MKLSIVVPAYNEERRIRPFLETYLPYFQNKYGGGFECIVVVNGSVDATADIARSFAERWEALKVLVEPRPIGKGGALMMGMEEAAGDFVGYVDADAATPPAAFDRLMDGMAGAGAVIASRWMKGSEVSPRQPLARRIASRAFNALVRLLFGLRITDTQCGAKLLRREALEEIRPRLGVTRWAFDVDLLFQLRRAGYRIAEVPTVWHDVSGSQLRVVKASSEMFVAVCRLRLIYSPLRWVVTVYDLTLGRLVRPRPYGG